MDPMDNQTFCTNKESPCNIFSVSYLHQPDENIDWLETSKKVWRPLVRKHIKLHSRIIKIWGEMFYQELDPEEVLNSQIQVLPEG
jgi:hypothetical protein